MAYRKIAPSAAESDSGSKVSIVGRSQVALQDGEHEYVIGSEYAQFPESQQKVVILYVDDMWQVDEETVVSAELSRYDYYYVLNEILAAMHALDFVVQLQ